MQLSYLIPYAKKISEQVNLPLQAKPKVKLEQKSLEKKISYMHTQNTVDFQHDEYGGIPNVKSYRSTSQMNGHNTQIIKEINT